MSFPRKPRSGPDAEHLLLLGVLVVFLAGAVAVAHTPAPGAAAESRSWISAIPSLGLPLLYTLLQR